MTRGWVQVQARAVDVIKRAAIEQLHRSRRGEALLLTAYLWGEEATEVQFMHHAIPAGSADWLVAQVRRHLADEARHASLLRARLQALGVSPSSNARVDPISARKLRQLHRLATGAAPSFRAGITVPVFAIAQHMEAMAVRVLRRHLDVLEGHGTAPDTAAMLASILEDEHHHERACAQLLEKLLHDDEKKALERLRAEIARIERSWGILGAVMLWLAGVWFSLWRGVQVARFPAEMAA